MFRSRHRSVVFILTDTDNARAPAMSISKLPVKSRWSRDLASGTNSASAIAPSEVRSVELRKTRLMFELTVIADRREKI